MSKRPAFQFYPADWKNNANLRRCSEGARGAWMDILCLLHDLDEYGVCRWPLAELARTAGVSLKNAKELAAKGVLKGSDSGHQGFTYTSTHAGKPGEPVILVPACEGPIWFSSRLVRDEWVRRNRGANTRFTTANQPTLPSPTRRVGEPVGERQGERQGEANTVRQGDGPSSSSSSSEVRSTERDKSLSAPPPLEKQVFDAGKALLGKNSGGFIAKLRKELHDDGHLLELIQLSRDKTDPREFLIGCVRNASQTNWPKPDDYGRIRGPVEAKTLFAMGRAIVGDGSDELVRGLMDAFEGNLAKAAEILLWRKKKPDKWSETKWDRWWQGIREAVRVGDPIDALSDIYPRHSY